ncbi:MAG: hypothetical protein QM674_06110 [Burkholderiaceae bacterium]
MSATINSLETSTVHRTARRFSIISTCLAVASLAVLGLLIIEPGTPRWPMRAPSWSLAIDEWGTGALGLLATLIVPILVGEAVSRFVRWRTGSGRGMLIWASTTLATAYLLSLLLSGLLSPAPI